MRGGALVIGSLYWDDDPVRVRWRRSLDLNRPTPVLVPIRYGRLSGRQRTPTMVFDPALCRRQRFGSGLAVPFRSAVGSIADIREQAEFLWKAEKKEKDAEGISGDWGCVGLLVNPEWSGCAATKRGWLERFNVPAPVPPVHSSGLLLLRWPQRLRGGPLRLDYLLATATRATPPERGYFLPHEIADAWIDRGSEDYFLNNRLSCINTYQDGAIWARFRSKAPAWLGEPRYSGAVRALKREYPQ